MKLSSKILVALMVASMSFGVVGCKGQPPEPPARVGEARVATNGAKISVEALKIEEPDFLDNSNRAVRPTDGQTAVAVLHVTVENPSGSDIAYKPLHFEGPKNRIQLCTDPDPDTGSRTDIKAISFEGQNRYHTSNQVITSSETIRSGGILKDEYLFEIPVVNEDVLVALIPGTIIGDSADKVFRFYVNKPTKKEEKKAPTALKDENIIDDVSVTVTKVVEEYAELVPIQEPSKKLNYAYAYTKQPVMAVYVTIKNNSRNDISYDPQHSAEKVSGISMQFAGSAQPRARIESTAFGKGQVNKKISIPSGQSQNDVYFFTVPGSAGPLAFNLSGHILGVRGIYRFALNFNPSNPPKPDLEPYKNKDAAAADAPAAEEANNEAEEKAAE